MLLIPCPWCGPRNQIEFTYGGDATVRRPAPEAPEAEWMRYVYVRDNPCGPHDELWLHSAGCRRGSRFGATRARTRSSRAPVPTSRCRGSHRDAACRLPAGGIVDRARRSPFEFDGVRYEGFAGDTLASALLANGVHLVGRSFKYHRPRGIVGAGVEEPNALVQLARGARTEPNVRATTQELYEGLVASSQNCWPSVRFDVGAINDAVLAAHSRRLLLQDVHVAADAEVVAPVRARDPPRRRAWAARRRCPIPITTSTSTRTATCS